jgi:hypothetical protein
VAFEHGKALGLENRTCGPTSPFNVGLKTKNWFCLKLPWLSFVSILSMMLEFRLPLRIPFNMAIFNGQRLVTHCRRVGRKKSTLQAARWLNGGRKVENQLAKTPVFDRLRNMRDSLETPGL